MSLIGEGLNKYALSPAAKDVLMVHGEKAHQSSITRTLANGISTVGTKTLMFFTLEYQMALNFSFLFTNQV